MAFEGHLVVDMDTHVREYVDPDRWYRDNIDPEHREAYERLSQAVAQRRESGETTALFMNPHAIIETSDESRPLGMHDTFGDRHGVSRASAPTETGPGWEIPRDVHWDPSIRLADMDKAGIDLCVVFPSHAPSYITLRDVQFERALHRAHSRYMNDYCSETEGRVRWLMIGTMRDPQGTADDLAYWAERDDNLVGVTVPPTSAYGRLLDNPDLRPIFQRAQDLDLPVMVHGGVLRPPYTAGAYELDNAGFIIRAVYQPWAGMTAMSALIGGGIFDLFPTLRVGIFETGAGWVPWLIEQLDDGFASRPQLVPFLRRKPSDILAEGRLFHAIEATEKYVPLCIDELGDHPWLFSTDYPHPASLPWPVDVIDFYERTDIASGVKYKILGENALRLCPRLS